MPKKTPDRITAAALLEIMRKETARTVKHYENDFLKYDAPRIMTEEEKTQKHYSEYTRGFTWITRECGTWMLSRTKDGEPLDPDFLRAVRDQWPDRREYVITHTQEGWTISRPQSFGKYSRSRKGAAGR